MAIKTEVKNLKPNIFNNIYFCFFLLLPFIYSDKIIDPVLIPRQLYLTVFILIVGLIICYWIYTKKLIPDFSFLKLSLPLLLVVFILITLISFSQSIAITESIYVLSKLTIELLFFIITTYLIIQNKLSVNSLIKAIVIFGFLSVIIAVYQMFSNENFLDNIESITSSFANKNLLSSVLFLTLPFIVRGIFLSKQWKITSIILLSIILVLFLLVQTKAVIVAFFLSFVIFSVFIIQRNNIKSKIIFTILFLSISFIISVFVFQNRQYFSYLTNIHTAYTRLNIWDNSIQMAKENLIVGVGAGNWQIQFPKYGLNKFDIVEIKNGLTTFQRPHNDFLWVFCETGIIGIATYVLIFLVALFYLIQLFKRAKTLEEEIGYSVFFAGVVGYMFIAFVDFPLERIEHQLLLYVLFSIVTARFYNISKTSKKTIAKLPLIIILFFIPTVFSFVVSVKRYSGEYHVQKMYNYHHQANWNQMIREVDKAPNVFYSMDPMSAPIKWYRGVALFSLGNINEAKTSFEQAYAIHPYNIHVLNNLASCYESQGDHQKAKEFYLKALSISPQFEETLLNLSAVYFNLNEYEKAFETIDVLNPYAQNPESYQVYLPVILNSWIELLLSKQTDATIIKKIRDIKNSKERTMEYYKASKNNLVTFKEYLLKY